MPTKHVRPFTSHVKMMTLTLVLPHWQRWFYQREIQMITGIAYTPVRAALISLSDGFGLVRKRTHGNRQYYMIDKEFFLYNEYKNIVLKTTGLGDHVRWLKTCGNDIASAFIYGDFAEGSGTTDTPIRFCCVGNVTEKKLRAATATAEKLTQKKIEFVRYSRRDFADQIRKKNSPEAAMFNSPKIIITGNEADFDALSTG